MATALLQQPENIKKVQPKLKLTSKDKVRGFQTMAFFPQDFFLKCHLFSKQGQCQNGGTHYE